MALQITDQSFDALLKENEVVVVDFWATWCGPCQMVGPIIEELAADYAGRAAIGKCDVDANSELPAQFGVRNIPTILFFKKGELVNKLVGAQPKAKFVEVLDSIL
ncbi:MAG: thioredoxin [Porphyromonas sp.]|jgi:thioredoxin